MSDTPKVVAIVGPTAAGKTSLGITLAKQFDGEVISVDSRQVYKQMDIGTAKAQGGWRRVESQVGGGIEQLMQSRKALFVDGVAHWGIDLVEPDEDFSVADFKTYAEAKIKDIVQRGHKPMLVGGTGFWMKALIDNYNLAETEADPQLRATLEKKDNKALFEVYQELDPEGAKEIDRGNKRKLVRALEVTKRTGEPFSKRQKTGKNKFNVLQIGVKVEREKLYEKINERVDRMIARGLVDEVRELRNAYGCESEAMTGVGYRQICQFLNGEISLEEAVRVVKRDTRHYAKRQITWFKRDDRINWIENQEEAIVLVRKFI